METILFMIIVGIISTIVGKTKSNQVKPGSKPFSMGQLKDVGKLFDEFTNNKPRETFSVETEKHTESKQRSLDHLQKEYEQVRQESETSRKKMAAGRQQAESSKIDDHQQTESLSLEHPDSNTLVNGIIWSEILGEPRAKRPYFQKR